MKVFIAVDMEGATGVVHSDQLMPEGKTYTQARNLLTDDVNAAIEGVLSVVPEATFVVCDGHGIMRNVVFENLHEAASLVIGPASYENKPLCQCQGIDETFDMAMMVGYHSMAGTPNGLLAHTYVGSLITNLRLNGNIVGEITMNTAIFGSFGVPVGLVTGNSCLEEEAKNISPAIEFVSTKESYGFTAALCYPPKKTKKLIFDGAARATKNLLHNQLKPIVAPTPVTIEVETYRREMTTRASAVAGIEKTGERTFAATNSISAAECFKTIWKGVTTAMDQPAGWLQ